MTPGENISVIIQCKGRSQHVLSSVESLKNNFPVIIIVDYNCPDNISKLVKAKYPHLHCVKETQDKFYNASKARNLGLKAARTPIVFFKDADLILSPSFIKKIQSVNFDDYFLLMGRKRALGANGSVVVSTEAANIIGGYDELFYGYGQQDIDFFERLKMIGLRPLYAEREPVEVMAHDVSDRSFFHPISRQEALLRNRIYGYIKRDIMSLTRRYWLPSHYRQELRRKCDAAIDDAFYTQKTELTITIAPEFSEKEYFSIENGGNGFNANGHISRSLKYRFSL